MAKRIDLIGLLQEANAQPASAGLDLRLDLSGIVLRALRAKGWSQNDLARAAGMKPSFISRVMHSDANCEFETVGRILTALGLHGRLSATSDSGLTNDDGYEVIADTGEDHGQTIIEASTTLEASYWPEHGSATRPIYASSGLSR